MSDQPEFLNLRLDISFQKNRLPHWQQDGCSYFITFRLADSLPMHLLEAWKAEREVWLNLHPKPWAPELEIEYHERFSGARERWLDAMHGECLLRRGEAREPLVVKLTSEVARVWSFVVMPNHVHVLVSLPEREALADWMQGIKGSSSREINQRLGRSGKLWARDYYDRLIRDGGHFYKCASYIRNNPEKAKLSRCEFSSFESMYVADLLK
ncbi:transposase [Coraliomargarita sp. W4R72]